LNDRLDSDHPTSRRAHVAALMLLLATVAWGFGFTWAKAGGETINRRLGLGVGAAIGPTLLLGVRFVLGALLMLTVFPRARRGWSRATVARSLALGSLLGVGMILQHLGLDRSSEAVTAFLTSLTILFVPILMTVALRRPPAPIFWGAVALATLGIWLMTGATPRGFGVGELLGLACALVFSVMLIAVNLIVPRDDPWRLTVGQFVIAAVITLAMCLLVQRGREALSPPTFARLFAHRDVWQNLALLVIFPTLFSYTAMSVFQPRLDPTRAALIYLMEPVFAAAYAWAARGSALTRQALAGAALILVANFLVEFIQSRGRSERATRGRSVG